jgi:hypothetical protein
MTVTPEQGRPVCDCCGGSGRHIYKPYLTASPYDDDCECSACGGTGTTWFQPKHATCANYRQMVRRR